MSSSFITATKCSDAGFCGFIPVCLSIMTTMRLVLHTLPTSMED